MTNVIIIHGTGGHPEENWFPWLKKELEKRGGQVFVPQFPNPQTPGLQAWLKEFEKYGAHFTSDTILIGHSLGGAFALRVLEKSKTKIRLACIIAAPIGVLPIKYYQSDKPFIEKPFDWEKIRKNCGGFAVFHSMDDPLVCVENGEVLALKLGVKPILLKNAGHFNSKAGYTKFKELLEVIALELKERK